MAGTLFIKSGGLGEKITALIMGPDRAFTVEAAGNHGYGVASLSESSIWRNAMAFYPVRELQSAVQHGAHSWLVAE